MSDKKQEEKKRENPLKQLVKGVTPPYLQAAAVAAAKLTGAGAVRTKEFCKAGAAGVREYNEQQKDKKQDKE